MTPPLTTPSLELTEFTFQWLDDCYPGMFYIYDRVRGGSGYIYDSIREKRLPECGVFINVCEDHTCCFKRGDWGKNLPTYAFAADPNYFDKIDKYVKLWLEKGKK